MYPNIIIAFNIAQNTMVGKIIIKLHGEDDNDLYLDMLNSTDFDSLADLKDLGAEFLDDIQIGDVVHICTKWFKLPDILDLVKESKEYFEGRKQMTKRVISIPDNYAKVRYENEIELDYTGVL